MYIYYEFCVIIKIVMVVINNVLELMILNVSYSLFVNIFGNCGYNVGYYYYK